MSVSDFFSASASTIGWTSTDFLKKWSDFSLGKIQTTAVFRRIFEGGHTAQSMHYAGLAADLRQKACGTHFPFCDQNHISLLPPVFPDISFGDIGLFVLVLQDALATLNFTKAFPDGFFGRETLRALTAFCHAHNIPFSHDNKTCTQPLWRKLSFLAAGKGPSPYVHYINKSKLIF